jgi:hypothetical protein
MNKDNTQDAIKFSLNNVRELEFNYINPYTHFKDFKPENYSFEFGLQANYRWNLEKNLFGVVLDFLYKARTAEEEDLISILKFSTLTEYRVENLDRIFTPRGKDDFDMDEKWETNFVSIAISTGRGMLITRAGGTVLHPLIFPLIDPSQVILSRKISGSKE